MKHKIKILIMVSSLFLVLSLVGCIGSSDKVQITQIAKNIEKAIEKKDVYLFMDNISYNYSDTGGGTYDNHINGLPEEMFSNIEESEDLLNFFSMFKIEQKVTIPESDIVVTDIYATGKMEIKISLEGCILWVICTDLYNENIEYNVDFIKEEDNWKIISMVEI
ncbi:unnamed protein product [marine sediment metagenome]|uniref:SnoaL-like domain-containing protein n=1 Tax=marine sediment metagenome TaxID=412755 RepID=X1VSF4_9ZZZZ